jgi:hypothetical protein
MEKIIRPREKERRLRQNNVRRQGNRIPSIPCGTKTGVLAGRTKSL